MSELVHVTASSGALVAEAWELAEHRDMPYLSEGRKHQINLQIGHIAFELQQRGVVLLDGNMNERTIA